MSAQAIKALLGAGAALTLLSGCSGGKAPAKAPADTRARAVTTSTVQRRPLTGGVVASGTLVSREEAAVTAEVNGFRVAKVDADVGDTVKAGQVLVELDDTLLKSQIDQQTALVAQADVAARQAAAQAQRVAGLDNTGAVAKEQIDQRRFAAETSAAALLAQKAALADLQTRVTKMQVRSPVNGRVLQRTVRPGDLSGGGQPMFQIARDSLIELSAEAPESSLRAIQPGSTAAVTMPNGQVIQGRVRLIEPTVTQQTHLGQVRIALPVRDDLRPGGSATAQFNDLRSDILTVPESALHYDADKVSVFVVDASNKVHEVPVRAGRRGGGFVELIEGPPEGSRVLLGSTSFVLEGDVVRPTDAGAAPAPPAAIPAPAKAAAK